ncbi:hypothetical protein ABTX85_38755 [Streptomyces sp. NPDC096097]|uniref:hypothetical protein n=1 Tax=Streptomyces sp. NPDC096097 TaxID=3155546 RepID=UPI00332075BE
MAGCGRHGGLDGGGFDGGVLAGVCEHLGAVGEFRRPAGRQGLGGVARLPPDPHPQLLRHRGAAQGRSGELTHTGESRRDPPGAGVAGVSVHRTAGPASATRTAWTARPARTA